MNPFPRKMFYAHKKIIFIYNFKCSKNPLKHMFLRDKLELVGETKREAEFISILEGFSNKAEFSNDLYLIKDSLRMVKYILEAGGMV